jgi:hypothetical protein
MSPWRPPGRYGASSSPMADFSGFYESPGPPSSGDALCISPAHRDGHRNGLRRRCIRSPPPPISIAVIVAKDHVMVHLTPSYYINLLGVISLFVYYGPPPMTRDAVSDTIVAGGRARIRLNKEVNINYLITTLI